MSIALHVLKWKACTRCQIGREATHHVFFRGSIPADILFVGEGPGETEDREGRPFVGKSGELVDEWIQHVQTARYRKPSDLFEHTWCITNTVCCRPTTPSQKNRPPTPLEIDNCAERFLEFYELVSPKAVICLGKVAGGAYTFEVPTLRVHHPAYVLRNGRSGNKVDLFVRSQLTEFIQEVFA